MPSESADPVSQAGLGVNWLVGISGAAIGGALTKLEWILKLPTCGKVVFFIAAFLFLVSMIAGVFYAFELFSLKQRKLDLEQERAKTPPDPAAVSNAEKRLKRANGKTALFHNSTMGSFFLAGVAAVISIFAVLFACPPIPTPAAKTAATNHFVLRNVPVHLRGKVSHSHTFLLNQQTGEMWLMQCRADKSVEFKRIPLFKLDGTPEDIGELNPSAAGKHATQ